MSRARTAKQNKNAPGGLLGPSPGAFILSLSLLFSGLLSGARGVGLGKAQAKKQR
jgi:hypothetical protein